MKRRFLSTLMALVLALSLIPTAALAASTQECPGGNDCSHEVAIGDKHYDTLYEAILYNFKVNDTLVLLKDCSTSYLTLSNNSVIDLNGHDLTYTGAGTVVFNGNGSQKATITDSTASGYEDGGTLKIDRQRDGAQSVFEIGNATLNISNINIDSTGCVFYPHGNSAVLNITNSDIKTKGIYCVSTNAGDPAYYGVTINIVGSSLTANADDRDDCAVMMNVSGSLNIEDSVITGNRQGVFARAGDVTIVDSEIVVTGAWANTDAGESYNGEWKTGNEVPTSALIVGNSSDNANSYDANATATISNTKITAPKESSVPAIYVDANNNHAASVSVSGSETVVTGNITNQEASGKASIVVTGGKFLDGNGAANKDVKTYFPKDSSLKIDEETGEVVTDDESTVAEVGGVPYKSLQAAIEAAASKATVKLRADVTESITIPKGKEIVLDLNGKKLVNSNELQNNTVAEDNRKHTITNNGTLTIIDSVGNGQVDNVSHGRTALYNEVGATATLDGGTYTRSAETGSGADTSGGNSYYTILNHGTMTINDGVTVNQGADGNGKYSSLVENGWQNGEQNETGVASVMTINGGTFSGGLNTIKNDDYGELIINGGELSSYAQACVLNWNTAKITGGTFDGTGSSNGVVLNGYLNNTMDKGELTITGGEFRGKSIVEKMGGSDNSGKIQITDGIFEVDTIATSLGDGTLEISGGNFSKSVPTEYLASSLNAELKRAAGTTPYSYYNSIAAATAAAQPGDTVTELRTTTEETYTVTLKYNDGRADGTVKATANTEITLPRPSRSGYDFRYWSNGSSTYNGGASYTVTSNVTLTAQWSAKSQGGSSSFGGSTTYSPTLDVSDGGTIKVSPRTPEAGDKVTITPDPDSGYEVGEVTVTDRSGDAVRVTANRDGTYTFTQPRGRVTIEVTFVRTGESVFFDDVPAAFWAYDEIAWAYDNGYVNGTSAATFSPNSSITRQQVWMILARLSGADPASMAAAREWAMANNISDGTNPGNAVTRQQLVALLYRYAQMMGYDNGAREALSSFPDAGTVSGYAQEPMQWSVANGIVAGTSAGTLNPTGTATRAQFAVILYRFWDQVG